MTEEFEQTVPEVLTESDMNRKLQLPGKSVLKQRGVLLKGMKTSL